MPKYNCPLCKQEVSKKLYEEITGIWQEREKRLKALKEKEKKLEKEAKERKVKFEAEKKKILAKHQKEIKKQRSTQKKEYDQKIKEQKIQLKEKREAIERKFQKKLITETNKILKEQQKQQKQHEKLLKDKFEKEAKEKLSKEKEKVKKQKEIFEKRERIEKNKKERLFQQFSSYRKKADKKIQSLEEQLKKDKTPQVLGLLEEKVFLAKLKETFPNDKFEHTGKGGDISHFIYEKDKMVGTIVYELKKVTHFIKAHITQTFKAKQKREADYGILVTNAKRAKDDYGFSVTKGIIIIHPAGALVLITILRNHLVEISRLKLSREERNRMVKAVLNYIRSPGFRNSLEGIIEDTVDLYNNLQKEIKGHIKDWEFRLNKYRNINSNANEIGTNVIQLLVYEDKKKRLPRKVDIEPIPLPEKIDRPH